MRIDFYRTQTTVLSTHGTYLAADSVHLPVSELLGCACKADFLRSRPWVSSLWLPWGWFVGLAGGLHYSAAIVQVLYPFLPISHLISQWRPESILQLY